MDARYFEDWQVDEEVHFGPVEVTRDAVLAFAREYDPQPFHLDDDAARASVFGKLAASGWQTAALAMRALVTSGAFGPAGLVGLGVDNLRWTAPVHPGDTLRVTTRVASKRASPGKPSGVVYFANTTRNAAGNVVMTHDAIALIPKRPSAD